MAEERCYSCEISVCSGLLIKDHCGPEKQKEMINEFLKGNMTIRDLQKELNIPEQALKLFKKEDVKLDLTLGKAVEIDNTQHLK